MKIIKMKIPWTIVVFMATISLYATAETSTPSILMENSRRWTTSMENDVRERLAQLDLPFEARYDYQIRDIIKDYAINGYRDTEAMLGRVQHYFPVFEHYLQMHDVPTALKYLPIVETGLTAKAYSGAGAAGLWQFIPSSARLYRLKINHQVDERLDTYRSTEAAAKMLSALYKQYKSWPLVLAAYNCGPVKVNQAIKAAGCRNYWELRSFLPKETQDYIPRFIAAAYIANFYADHALQPSYKSTWPLQSRVVKVYEGLTFGEIAFATGVDIKTLHRLNPSYKGSRILESQRGNFLVLPADAVEDLNDYLCSINGGHCVDPILLYPNFHQLHYVVKPGESMTSLASRFNCKIEQIKEWNHLKDAEVHVNQELVLYLSDSGYIKP